MTAIICSSHKCIGENGKNSFVQSFAQPGAPVSHSRSSSDHDGDTIEKRNINLSTLNMVIQNLPTLDEDWPNLSTKSSMTFHIYLFSLFLLFKFKTRQLALLNCHFTAYKDA